MEATPEQLHARAANYEADALASLEKRMKRLRRKSAEEVLAPMFRPYEDDHPISDELRRLLEERRAAVADDIEAACRQHQAATAAWIRRGYSDEPDATT